MAAEQYLDGAVALDPRDDGALRGLATMAARRGDWARAVQHLVPGRRRQPQPAGEGAPAPGGGVDLRDPALGYDRAATSSTSGAQRCTQATATAARGGCVGWAVESAGGFDAAAESDAGEFTPESPTRRWPAERGPPGPGPRSAGSAGRRGRGAPAAAPPPEAAGGRPAQLRTTAALRALGSERSASAAAATPASATDARTAGACRHFSEALGFGPTTHPILHDVLELLDPSPSSGRRRCRCWASWPPLETGQGRGPATWWPRGNILNYELRAPDEAVDVYNQALDEDPDDLKTFERIEKILGAKRAWRDEARNFRRMIKRLGPPARRRRSDRWP